MDHTGAIKVAIHRLRGRYRKTLHREIRETLSDPEDGESEIQFFMIAEQA
jgi:RNA polymerase sigma-70 factor (ECF subfamily)